MKLHIVPAQTGFTWVKLGVQAFRRQPLALAALFFLSFVAMSLLASVPVLGNIASLVLLPSVTLAMMVATGESIQGHTPTPALLLITFRKGRQHLRHMLLLGALVISIVALLLGLGGEGVGRLLMGAAMMMATMILSCAVFIFRDCFEPPESLLHGAHHETTPPPPTAGPN